MTRRCSRLKDSTHYTVSTNAMMTKNYYFYTSLSFFDSGCDSSGPSCYVFLTGCFLSTRSSSRSSRGLLSLSLSLFEPTRIPRIRQRIRITAHDRQHSLYMSNLLAAAVGDSRSHPTPSKQSRSPSPPSKGDRPPVTHPLPNKARHRTSPCPPARPKVTLHYSTGGDISRSLGLHTAGLVTMMMCDDKYDWRWVAKPWICR